MPTPCEREIQPLSSPWTKLSAIVRFCWTSAHPNLEVRYISIVGDKVTASAVVVANGKIIVIDDIKIPWGAQANWLVMVLVNDPTNNPMKGLSVVVEFSDDKGRCLRGSIASKKDVPPGVETKLEKAIVIPEQVSNG
jgi:hypothetical protein